MGEGEILWNVDKPHCVCAKESPTFLSGRMSTHGLGLEGGICLGRPEFSVCLVFFFWGGEHIYSSLPRRLGAVEDFSVFFLFVCF